MSSAILTNPDQNSFTDSGELQDSVEGVVTKEMDLYGLIDQAKRVRFEVREEREKKELKQELEKLDIK